MTDTVLGAIIGACIALVAGLSTQVLTHFLSLREDKIKRQRDADKELRESLGVFGDDKVMAARMAERIGGKTYVGLELPTTPFDPEKVRQAVAGVLKVDPEEIRFTEA